MEFTWILGFLMLSLSSIEADYERRETNGGKLSAYFARVGRSWADCWGAIPNDKRSRKAYEDECWDMYDDKRNVQRSQIQGENSIKHAAQFCPDEYVEVTCSSGETLNIESARYGRMNMGRCIEDDIGYIGCESNVTPTLDMYCGGLERCHMSMDNPYFKKFNACPEDMESYLEVTWSCS